MNDLIANGKNILFKKIEQDDEKQSTILISLGDVNPTLIYGKVISTGSNCSCGYDGEFVYVQTEKVSKLIHLGIEYWIADEEDILVYIEDKVKEREVKPLTKQSGGLI